MNLKKLLAEMDQTYGEEFEVMVHRNRQKLKLKESTRALVKRAWLESKKEENARLLNKALRQVPVVGGGRQDVVRWIFDEPKKKVVT